MRVRQKILKILIFAAVLSFVVIWIKSLKQDLNLTVAKNDANSHWEFGEVKTVRVIGNDIWNIKAAKVTRMPTVDHFQQIAAKISGPSGPRTINAPTGEYDDQNKTLLLFDADGTWERPDEPLNWSTPQAQWQTADDVWDFPKGVTVVSEFHRFDADSALMKAQSEIHAVNGCILWWSEE